MFKSNRNTVTGETRSIRNSENMFLMSLMRFIGSVHFSESKVMPFTEMRNIGKEPYMGIKVIN